MEMLDARPLGNLEGENAHLKRVLAETKDVVVLKDLFGKRSRHPHSFARANWLVLTLKSCGAYAKTIMQAPASPCMRLRASVARSIGKSGLGRRGA